MKTILITILTAIALATFFPGTAFADDLQELSGKWTVKKTNAEGQAYSQVIEITKDKFTFRILNSDDRVVFFAKGDIQLQKLGPFNSIKFKNMKIGESSEDAQPFDEDRDSIYQLTDGTLTLASNFDAKREQAPSLDVYKKAASTAKEPKAL